MKKQIPVQVYKEYISSLTGEFSTNTEFKKLLEILQSPEPRFVSFYTPNYEEDSPTSIVVCEMVEETDEQYNKRVIEEERIQRLQEENERRLYETLKKKFEG